MEETATKKPTKIKFKTEWELDSQYKGLNDPKLKNDIKLWEEKETEFVEYFKKNSLVDADENLLLEYYQKIEGTIKVSYPIFLYVSYISSLDTQNQDILKKDAELENIWSKWAKEGLFIDDDFKKIGYKKLMKFSKSDKLKDYKNKIVSDANNIKYSLSKSKEELIIEKNKSGSNIIKSLHTELTNSFMFNYRGQEMTKEEVSALLSDVDESVRKDASMALREVYGSPQTQITLGSVYKSIVKDKVNEGKLRGVEYVMEVRNNSEQMKKETVDMLLECVRNSYGTYHKYLKLKALLIGKEHLNTWDRHVPYVVGEQKKFPFEEGLNMYLDVIKKFDKEFYDYSVDMFEKGRVDVYPKKGKQGGAYASYTQGLESHVLLNYTDLYDDVQTLAHELGHAIHGHLSQVQKPLVYSSPLSLAETASIFNETLMFDTLAANVNSKDEKISMLVENLDAQFGTIFRQVQIVLFEREVHDRLRNEEELTYVDFNKIWRKLTSEIYGDVVHFDTEAEKDYGWSSIPHIFATPFYCYTYAFGNLLSLSLYDMYKKEGDDFIPKYKNILKAGGSVPPEELLMRYGIDITKPEFYNGGLKVIDDMVNELSELIMY